MLVFRARLIVPAIKNDLVRLFVGLAEMGRMPYFMEHPHFGATGRLGGADHFFSPAQILKNFLPNID
jgi:hypothetical protein